MLSTQEPLKSLSRDTEHTLTSGSQLLLASTLEQHGNTLSSEHRAALHALCSTLTGFAAGELQGRKVFALPTGAGKTSAVIVWLTVLHRLGEKARGVSVSVSASKVEALSKIKQALMDNGVPEEIIGLKHSLGPGPNRLPSTGDEDRRFMLVTHQRVRGGTNHKLFTQHRGTPRNLLVYDESLFKSDSIAISARDVRGGLGFLLGVVDDQPEVAGVIEYLTQCRDLIAEAVKEAQACPPDAPEKALEVALPVLAELEQAGYPELLHSVMRRAKERALAEPLVDLIAFAGQTLRVAVTPQGEGLLWHRLCVPEELQNVLVLDASYPIRTLCQLDKTLKDANERLSKVNVKRFDSVTVHQMFAPGGRSTVATSFLQEKREKRAVSQEVVEVVKRIPSDEAVLVFLFKDSKGDIERNLKFDLRDAGVDLEATVDVRSEKRDRIRFATWGSETSSNDHSYCKHVVLAGVLHRSLLDLASAAVGQLDDRKAKLDGKWLLELMRSEVSHCVYQAISRGACREVDNGQAKQMDAYVILPWPLEPRLREVMPGAKYKVWEPLHSKGLGDGVVVRMALAILDHLKGLPAEVRKVATKRIREALGITVGQKRAFERAVKQLADMGAEWARKGHSLVRVDAQYHGFTPE